MIEQLTIQGFKSFDMDAPKLRLSPLNFIVGANGSGKSNLLAALRFLRLALLEDIEMATAAFNGVEEVRNLRLRQVSGPKPVVLEVTIREPSRAVRALGHEVMIDIRQLSYRLVVDMRADNCRPVITEELLEAMIECPGEPLAVFTARRDRESIHVHNPLAVAGGRDLRQSIDPLSRNKLIGAAPFQGQPMAVLRSYVESWRHYCISPPAVRHLQKLPTVKVWPRRVNGSGSSCMKSTVRVLATCRRPSDQPSAASCPVFET